MTTSPKGSKLHQAVDFILQHVAVQNPDLKRAVSEHRAAIENEIDQRARAAAAAAAPAPETQEGAAPAKGRRRRATADQT